MPQQTETAYLRSIGERVRALRAERKLTRKRLASTSGVSERYLAQLESGQGNISVLLLRLVAHALGAGVEDLVRESAAATAARERRRVALVGLRGAGKSSIGTRLAEAVNAPFVELDHQVETEAGANLGEIFSLYGQDGYRRFERRALSRVLRQNTRAVIATGGSLVTEPETYRELLSSCFTVWLKASPEEHMQRVMAQGDMRPMQGRAAAMDELRRILQERAPLYAKADATLDTTGKTVRQCVADLRRMLAAG
jgi:XRE family aerobic/anaerobic benzoate catabolism transcriptional regulator